MRRIFSNIENKEDGRIRIEEDDRNHLVNVLRMEEGDEVRIVAGEEIHICVLEYEGDEAYGRIVEKEEKSYESPLRIRLYQALLKGDRFDYALQKATELGVDEIIPLETSRTVVKLNDKKYKKRKKRYERIVEEAAKQSKRTAVPAIGELTHVKEIPEGPMILAYENEEHTKIIDIIETLDREVTIVIGPEGGFSEEEVRHLEEKGAVCVGFGPRILRGETAPVFLISVLQYELGDM